jgi:hypothetical protein
MDDNLHKHVNHHVLFHQLDGFVGSHQIDGRDSYSMYSQYSSFHDKYRTAILNSDPQDHGLMESYVDAGLPGSNLPQCDNKNISIQIHLHESQVHDDIANIHLGFPEKPSRCGNLNIELMNVFRPVRRNLHVQNYLTDQTHRGKRDTRTRIAPDDQP